MNSDSTVTSAGSEHVSGLVRRVRRLAELSQRELAARLGVSQSAVAKWETGRTSPSARTLMQVLGVASLTLAAVRPAAAAGAGPAAEPAPAVEAGPAVEATVLGETSEPSRALEVVVPMRSVAARDAAGRRYPAHTFVWAQGWWVPNGVDMTPWYSQVLLRSERLGLPLVRYSRWRPYLRPRTLAPLHEHPTWEELVAAAEQCWRPSRTHLVSIPEDAFEDSHRSRNRQPEAFRALARVTEMPRRRRPAWMAS